MEKSRRNKSLCQQFHKKCHKEQKKLKSVREIRKYVEFVKEYANSIDPLSDYFKDIP